MTYPSTATFETGGAKIHRIPLQVFPKFWAYAYLVVNNDLRILVDAGSGTDASHENLLKGLDRAGVQPQDLTNIILTHAHIDHYGGLTKLKPLTPAKVGCHELDVQTVTHHEARQAVVSHRLGSFLTYAGLAKDEVDSLLNIYRFTKTLYNSIPVDFTLQGDQGNVESLPFNFIHLPGHCPGHIALRLDDIILCGDMVVEGVTPHLTPETIHPFSGLDRYLDSLHKFQLWAPGARLILNGHDAAITDLPAVVNATHNNILRRMRSALEALAEPCTIAEVCNIVYEKPSGYNLLLTLEKMGAYIEHLYEHAMIEVVNADEVEQGMPARYRRLREIADEEILLIKHPSVVE